MERFRVVIPCTSILAGSSTLMEFGRDTEGSHRINKDSRVREETEPHLETPEQENLGKSLK